MATKPKTAAKPRAKKPVVVTDRTRIKSILGTAQFLGVDRSVIERLQRCFGELRQTMMSLSARISRSMDGFPKEKVDAWCTAVDVIIRDALQAAADSIEDAKIETPEYVTMKGVDANSSV